MASKNISFVNIPGGIKKPGVYIEQDTSLAFRALPSTARRILLIGLRLTAGSVAELVPMQVFSEAEAATYFGFGSMLHLMVRAAMKENPYADITCIALNENAGGVQADGTIAITGTSTSAGTIRAFIGDQYVDVAIASGSSETTIAAAVKAAVNAKTDLPVTSDNTAGSLAVTARHKGLGGNDIGLGYELTGALGISVAVTPMANGATNPSLSSALAVVAGTRYHLIVTPFNNQTDLGTLKTHINTVSGPVEQRGCVGIYAFTGALGAATTLSGQINHLRTPGGVYCRYTAATQKKTPSWQLAAIAAAAISALSDIAAPIKNLTLKNVAMPATADRLTRTEHETCLAAGVAPIETTASEVRIVRMPASYATDDNGQAVFVDIHRIFGLDYVRDAAISDLGAKAPNKIIREGAPTTIDILRNIVLDTAYKCQEAGVLTGVTSYKDQYIVEEDLQNVGQMNILMPSPVVQGLYVVAVKQVLY